MMNTAPRIPPGWFGKLPGIGDFAHRRLPPDFIGQWDPWLQDGLSRLRQRHDDWTARYLGAPLWCFVLGPGVVGEGGWAGVLMPSVDGVGRYFPFTVAWPWRAGDAGLHAAWALASRVALEALERDLDAARFEALLASAGAAPEPGTGMPEPAAHELPGEGQTLWLAPADGPAAPPLRIRCAGLPRQERFDTLFGWGDAAPAVDAGTSAKVSPT